MCVSTLTMGFSCGGSKGNRSMEDSLATEGFEFHQCSSNLTNSNLQFQEVGLS
jgi:hypothetical protein